MQETAESIKDECFSSYFSADKSAAPEVSVAPVCPWGISISISTLCESCTEVMHRECRWYEEEKEKALLLH